MTESTSNEELLSATHVMEYDYRRSLGPVLSRFFTGLQAQKIHGARTRTGLSSAMKHSSISRRGIASSRARQSSRL